MFVETSVNTYVEQFIHSALHTNAREALINRFYLRVSICSVIKMS